MGYSLRETPLVSLKSIIFSFPFLNTSNEFFSPDPQKRLEFQSENLSEKENVILLASLKKDQHTSNLTAVKNKIRLVTYYLEHVLLHFHPWKNTVCDSWCQGKGLHTLSPHYTFWFWSEMLPCAAPCIKEMLVHTGICSDSALRQWDQKTLLINSNSKVFSYQEEVSNCSLTCGKICKLLRGPFVWDFNGGNLQSGSAKVLMCSVHRQ